MANTVRAIVAGAKLGMAKRAMQYCPEIARSSRKNVDCMNVEPHVDRGNIAGP